MLEKIVFAVFAATFLSSIAIYLILREKVGARNRRIRKRLDDLATETAAKGEMIYPILRDDKLSEIPALNRILSKLRLFKNLQRLIYKSGVPMKASALVLAMLSLGGLVLLLALTLLNNLLFALVPAFVVGSLPYLYILRKKKTRKENFESFLPEATDLMVNALKSGFSLEAALKMVAREVPDPVGIEFGIAFEVANRVESDELSLLITALLIHRKTGGNLAEILERIAATVRQRFKLEREVKIHSAYGRLSGVVLVFLPIIVGIIIFALNPEYLKVLWVEKAGRYLVGTAIIMQIMGIWVINRIVNIKF